MAPPSPLVQRIAQGQVSAREALVARTAVMPTCGRSAYLRTRSPRSSVELTARRSRSAALERSHATVWTSAPGDAASIAARGGTVMQVESDFDKAGLNLEKYGGRANYVRILHPDGTTFTGVLRLGPEAPMAIRAT